MIFLAANARKTLDTTLYVGSSSENKNDSSVTLRRHLLSYSFSAASPLLV